VRVSVCVTVEVPTTTFSAIEEACVVAGRKAAKEALLQALHRLEARRGPRARGARHGRRRTLLTKVGRSSGVGPGRPDGFDLVTRC
jgi:hypothetical protein